MSQPSFEQILTLVKETCQHAQPIVDENTSPKAIKITKEDLKAVCTAMLENELAYFDLLSCITGLDNGLQAATMEVIYNLYSIPYNTHLMLKVILPREGSEIDSVTSVWKTANWHEREIFDMFGIRFNNHPDLRRILMPADWEGNPLKKDYKHQEYYRNIKVKY